MVFLLLLLLFIVVVGFLFNSQAAVASS